MRTFGPWDWSGAEPLVLAPARVLQGVGPDGPGRSSSGVEDVFALASSPRHGRLPEFPFRARSLCLQRDDPRGDAGASAAMEASARRNRRGFGRGAGQTLRRAGLQPAGQAEGVGDGGEPPGCAAGASPAAGVDGGGHQGERPGQARCHAPEDRLSRRLARLRRLAGQPDRVPAERPRRPDASSSSAGWPRWASPWIAPSGP